MSPFLLPQGFPPTQELDEADHFHTGPIYHLALATQTGIVQRFESDTGPSLPVCLVKVGIGGWLES